MNLAILKKLAPHLSTIVIGALVAQGRNGVTTVLAKNAELKTTYPSLPGILDDIKELRGYFPRPGEPVRTDLDFGALLLRSVQLFRDLAKIPDAKLDHTKQMLTAGALLLAIKMKEPDMALVEELSGLITSVTMGSLFAEARNHMKVAAENAELTKAHPSLPTLLSEIVKLRGLFPKTNEPARDVDFPAAIKSCIGVVQDISKVPAAELDLAKGYLYGAVVVVACQKTEPAAPTKPSPKPAAAAPAAAKPSPKPAAAASAAAAKPSPKPAASAADGTKSQPATAPATLGPSDSDVVLGGPATGVAEGDTGVLDDAIAAGNGKVVDSDELLEFALAEDDEKKK